MEIEGFDWDWANSSKSLKKHGISREETEEVFLHKPLVFEDTKHSQAETRYIVFGKTSGGKLLTIAYTLRRKGNKVFVRPISSRVMHKKERMIYEEAYAQHEEP